ncbi:hypothetical protein V6N12_009839 [Hibiscus sabdariffa]|uniref:Subtilisin-like protease SBT1.2 n=1 Tax=Hibiscus sabdariffa TaxID=183260 RepID=A0ABR2EBZ5_9ROSI
MEPKIQLLFSTLCFCLVFVHGDTLQTYIVQLHPQGLTTSLFPSKLHWHLSFLQQTLSSQEDPSSRLLYSYGSAIQGFAARLTETELELLQSLPDVVAVRPDRLHQLHTTYSYKFLGLSSGTNGAWVKSGFGRGTIIGVLDTAGNSGPLQSSVANIAPWIATIGAGTLDRKFPAIVRMGNKEYVYGESLFPGKRLPSAEKEFELVYVTGGSSGSEFCFRGSLPKAKVQGKMVVCDRGVNGRAEKGVAVKEAGGAAMILANTEINLEEDSVDAHVLPATEIGYADAVRLKTYMNATRHPRARIIFGGTVIRRPDEYVIHLCTLGYTRSDIFTITHRNVSCSGVLKMNRGFSLNYPSISVVFKKGTKSKMITRRVTNVGNPYSVYSVKVKSPEGVKVRVKPRRLIFKHINQSLSYRIWVTSRKKTQAKKTYFAEGELTWMNAHNNFHRVRSPISVTWK